MTRHVELLIVGAGPAGMSAAIAAKRHGLDVLVVDEQASPGGQIWRNVENATGRPWAAALGKSYADGAEVVRRFRASAVAYEPQTQVWQLEAGRAFLKRGGVATSIDADYLLLATGAQERPAPFPGWTLPGVMTVGAAQIVMKSSGQIPTAPVWVAGSGPLALVYAVQLLQAGGRIAGFLDTTPAGRARAALSKLPMAMIGAPGDLVTGLSWIATLRRQVPFVRHVSEIEAFGRHELESIRYTTADGNVGTTEARLLLVHEGLVPTIHPTLALGCRHVWNHGQDSFGPGVDEWGETSAPNVFVAGDGASIAGAAAATWRGEIAALRIAARAGRMSQGEATAAAARLQARLRKALSIRPFLDAYYRPRPAVFAPSAGTIACRCEEIDVATIRAQAANARPGPNQVKAFTRAGMGPCQGRQCSYTVAHVLAAAEGRAVPDVGLYRVRPPIKPITLGELAALDGTDPS